MLLKCWCQIRQINHASIDIVTCIIGGRRWHGIWQMRWSPTWYWIILQLMCCVIWRSGSLLTNRRQLSWINDWIIQWSRHIYHQWWKIIALWVTVLAIKSPVIMRSVLWRIGWLLKNGESWDLLMTEIFNGRGIYITINDNLLIFEWVTFWLKQSLSQGVVRCLTWLFPVPLLWRLPIPLKHRTMNAIWVCGLFVCLLFYLLMAIKRWDPTFWRDNFSHVWFSVPGIKLITRILSQYHPN